MKYESGFQDKFYISRKKILKNHNDRGKSNNNNDGCINNINNENKNVVLFIFFIRKKKDTIFENIIT